jgi:hypothetical protein
MSGIGVHVDRIRTWFSHAFAVAPPEAEVTPEEAALAGRLACFVVRRRMTAPALMALESSRPLNFLGSQVLTFFGPFATLVFKGEEYERFTRFLEKRGSIPFLIDKITEEDEACHA